MSCHWFKVCRTSSVLVLLLAGLAAQAQLLPDPPAEDEPAADEIDAVEEPRYYSIEVIVFENSSAVSAGNEVFDPEPAPEPDPAQDSFLFGDRPDGNFPLTDGDDETAAPGSSDEETAIEYGDFIEPVVEDTELEEVPSLAGIGFRRLLPEEMTMTAIHEKLLLLDAYHPVLWGGWLQAAAEQDASLPIRLRTLGSAPIGLDGDFTLYLKNYLHLVVDLTMQQTIATFQPVYRQQRRSYGDRGFGGDFGDSYSDTQKILYRIQEDRIFRGGHLRYFDHPKFGVLVRVNRVEQSESQDAEEVEIDGPAMLSRNPQN